jgi:hypothetical protein
LSPVHEAVRRGKFSLLLWPSLYSLGAILLTPLAFIIIAGIIALSFHTIRQDERQLVSRASERIKAIMALKLSGVESWQWKRALRCENHEPDCLALKLSFIHNVETNSYSEKIIAPESCKICHAKNLASQGSFSATFTSLPAAGKSRWIEITLLGACAIMAIALVVWLFILRSRRRQEGICIAAFEHDTVAGKAVKNFLRRLAGSRSLSYYAETQPNRIRIATTPEVFGKILSQNREFLESNRGSLRLIALHIELKQHTLIPIEILRSVFQFLGRVPARTYLIQEKLLTRLDANYENGRRLVFKNKSGALLKFVPWESK